MSRITSAKRTTEFRIGTGTGTRILMSTSQVKGLEGQLGLVRLRL